MTDGKDKMKWKQWYWGLIMFLLAQIILYIWITNIYSS